MARAHTDAGPDDGDERPRRIDAQRNRETILRAAMQVLGDLGVDAQMTDIAAAAGLGVGTVYRNFPSKEALVNALVLDRLVQGTRLAERVSHDPDAFHALRTMLRGVLHDQLENRVMSHFLAGRIAGSEELQQQRDTLYALLNETVQRAQSAGQLRPDVAVSDIRMALMAISRVASSASPVGQALVVRFLDIVLDGLRAPAHSKLVGRAPTIAESENAFNPGSASSPGPLHRGRRRWPVET